MTLDGKFFESYFFLGAIAFFWKQSSLNLLVDLLLSIHNIWNKLHCTWEVENQHISCCVLNFNTWKFFVFGYIPNLMVGGAYGL